MAHLGVESLQMKAAALFLSCCQALPCPRPAGAHSASSQPNQCRRLPKPAVWSQQLQGCWEEPELSCLSPGGLQHGDGFQCLESNTERVMLCLDELICLSWDSSSIACSGSQPHHSQQVGSQLHSSCFLCLTESTLQEGLLRTVNNNSFNI